MESPKHYEGEVQPWDIIAELRLGFNLGNVVKHVFRAGKKDGNSVEQDLNKAIAYLEEEIKRPNQYVFSENEADYQLNISYLDNLYISILLDWLLFGLCRYLFFREYKELDDCIILLKKHTKLSTVPNE